MNRNKLDTWLRKQLFSSRDEGPCVKLTLRHLGSDGRGKGGELWTKQMDNAQSLGEDALLEIMTDIETSSFDDSEGIGGLQRYQVLAYYQHSMSPLGRFTFRMEGGENEDEFGLSEPATKQGFLGQVMRHNEGYAKANMFATNQVIGMLSRTVNQLAEHNEKLMVERRRSYETQEELLSLKHERDLMSIEAETKAKHMQALFDKGNILLPALVNRISGKKILPEETGPMTDMLKSFAETLDPQQLAYIMKGLRPEQQIAMIEFLQATQKEKQLTDGNGSNGVKE